MLPIKHQRPHDIGHICDDGAILLACRFNDRIQVLLNAEKEPMKKQLRHSLPTHNKEQAKTFDTGQKQKLPFLGITY